MQRNLDKLSEKEYDLIIVGGGIYGACTAWDATLRGLSVALVEKVDFGSATSANSQKIIHGGLRYLQNVDYKRMRESIRERRIFMRIAPHLVHLLPCLIPTYGYFSKGKEILRTALFLYNIISCDRNKMLDPTQHIPKGRIISREECLKTVPGIDKNGLTGAAIWYDGQAYNTERFILSFLLSASQNGADIANYAEVIGFLKDKDTIRGVKVKDNLTKIEFEIRSKLVINTSGPWLEQVIGLTDDTRSRYEFALAKSMNLVTRQFIQDYAFGVSYKNDNISDKKNVNNESRFFFITPWRNFSLIGTTYEHYQGHPNELKVTKEDINKFINEVNKFYPYAQLCQKDVYFYHVGLVPISKTGLKNGKINTLKHYQIYDHKKNDDLDGLISVLGVKYTTARDVAQKVINLVFRKLQKKSPKPLSEMKPIYGGDIENFADYLNSEKSTSPKGLSPKIIERLIYNYGSEYNKIIKYIDQNDEFKKTVSGSNILIAEVIHAVREEMAQKLSDVVLRRTELGTAGNPGDSILNECAVLMAQELKWDKNRIEKEIHETKAGYTTQ